VALVEPPPELLYGALQTGPDRIHGNGLPPRDLLRLEPVVEPGHDGGLVRLAKLLDRLDEPPLGLQPRREVVRGVHLPHLHGRRLVPPPPGLRSPAHEREVARDPGQPGAQPAPGRGPVLEADDEGLLRDVLRLVRVAQEAQRERAQEARVGEELLVVGPVGGHLTTMLPVEQKSTHANCSRFAASAQAALDGRGCWGRMIRSARGRPP
jgi:hypothetical protein